MWYIIIFIIAGLGILAGFTSFTSCANPNPEKVNTPPDSIKGSYNRAEVDELLESLANGKVKENLDPGAMCYSPKPIAERAEYVCPVCGEKTHYSWNNAEFVKDEIPVIRQMASHLKTTVKLDESQFCRKCTPDTIENPQICIIVQLEGQAAVKTCGIQRNDLNILTCFFEGKNIYKLGNDGEVALKERIPRIKELLGIKED